MNGSIKNQLMELVWRITNLSEHCEFHTGDKDAKRELKVLKARKKRWVAGLRRNERNWDMLISLKLMRKPIGYVSPDKPEKASKVKKSETVAVTQTTSPDGSQVYPTERMAKKYLKANSERMQKFLDRRGAKTL